MEIYKEYSRLRSIGWHASAAYHIAQTNAEWDRLGGFTADDNESAPRPHLGEGMLRLRYVVDNWSDFDDLCGDCFNPEVNGDIPESRLIREREAFRETVEREGVWGIVAEIWNARSEEWEEVDACGGFVGNNLRDNGYDTDAKRAAIDALRSRCVAGFGDWPEDCVP